MQRYLGLDIGKKRTGVALVDDENRVATPLETISFATDSQEFVSRLCELIEEWEPKALITGLPIDLKGKESIAATQMREMVAQLQVKINSKLSSKADEEIEFVFIDERLTTAQVERSMKNAEFSAEYRKKHRDALAAALIAQSWADTL